MSILLKQSLAMVFNVLNFLFRFSLLCLFIVFNTYGEQKDEQERTERSFDCNNKKINVLLLRNPRELQVKNLNKQQATSIKPQNKNKIN